VRTPTLELLTLLLFGALLVPSAGAEVDFQWVAVGDPGNECDQQTQGCFGSVLSIYRIARTEVTNSQYVEFLNAVATTDTYDLYDPTMASGLGGIVRSGSAGSYRYAAIAGRENRPVNFVSFWDATRFANWLHNGQPAGAQDDSTTEDGSHEIFFFGGVEIAGSGYRKTGSRFFLPSDDEWYKAAYYDPASSSYFDFPAGSDSEILCSTPGGGANTANCLGSVGDLTDVGSYPGAMSPNGTYDQGGNVWEWTQSRWRFRRVMRGGGLDDHPVLIAAFPRVAIGEQLTGESVGFRVASKLPQLPGLGPVGLLLLVVGLCVVGGRRALSKGSALLVLAAALVPASPAEAQVSFDWVTVGDPGNDCDPQMNPNDPAWKQGCFGGVPYGYQISKHAVTHLQWAAYLNAVYGSGPSLLSSPPPSEIGDLPVTLIDFWDVLRFVNWLHNGQPTGPPGPTTTEDGAYTMTADGILNNTITRNPGATIFLTSEDEWYKAAYYDEGSSSYFQYPAGTDTQTTCAGPESDPNTANCDDAVRHLVPGGSYTASASPSGTFDQGGNCYEWNEAIGLGGFHSLRGRRGGIWSSGAGGLSATVKGLQDALSKAGIGFRVARPVP
jgi:formylglycine-generating enzyme required for sulfatase activity